MDLMFTRFGKGSNIKLSFIFSIEMKEQVVILRHTVKNALISVATRSVGLIGRAAAAQPLYGLQLPILVGDAVIMENIFNLPGLGRLLLSAL